MSRHTDPRPMYYGLLRVRAERDGRLVPLWYGVGTDSDFDQMTVVGGEYTVAFCRLPHAATYELACRQLHEERKWFEPLLKSAVPEGRFAEEVAEPFACGDCGENGHGFHVCPRSTEL
ncbi:MAG TPA: hypothetical protein VLE97_08740 [Gaiellaceae bacterium]|nr:hypothetical protein [Gaiellaceae bacterium]